MRHNETTATAPTALVNVPHHHASQAPVGTNAVEQVDAMECKSCGSAEVGHVTGHCYDCGATNG
jgi:uncharacterized protein CbrC (UPF0167 family)